MSLTKYGNLKKESVTCTLRMSPELLKRLEKVAKKRRVSKNALAVGILTEVLKEKVSANLAKNLDRVPGGIGAKRGRLP